MMVCRMGRLFGGPIELLENKDIGVYSSGGGDRSERGWGRPALSLLATQAHPSFATTITATIQD